MNSTTSILLTEEDPTTRAFLAENLAADGYQVLLADSKQAALAKLETRRPDIVICDVNGATLDLIDAVRGADGLGSRIDASVPLIVLTARADELARVRYLDRGSDDVLEKPVCYPELRARVTAVLRRCRPRQRGRVTRVGPLHIDHAARDVRLADTPIAVSATEYALLAYLAGDPARVFTKPELLRDVWGYRAQGRTRTVDSHACRLRHKLLDAGHGRWIECVWGVGYRLVPLAQQQQQGRAA